MPEATIWGYVPIEGFSKYVGPRPVGNTFPNPIRGAFALLGMLEQGMASIDLNDVLRSTGELGTITLCFGTLGNNIGNVKLPANLLLPDLIRQNWMAECSGHYKMSNPAVHFRIFTDRQNITRTILVIGASVGTSNYSVYAGLNITTLPITMTTIGTQNINIPALTRDINMRDDTGGPANGNWGIGALTGNDFSYFKPHAVPFEFDFRTTAQGRRVYMHSSAPPYDPERVKLGAGAAPPFGDPNRAESASHQGQFFCLGNDLMILGNRAPYPIGLIPMQMKTVPQIDDNFFTVFQRMNTQSKAFTNVEPWGNATGNTHVISDVVVGLPSTQTDTEVNWAATQAGLVWLKTRGFIDPAINAGVGAVPTAIPGNTASVKMLASVESVQNTTQGMASWLPLPTVSDPTDDGYRIPQQNEIYPPAPRAWPINRNGQIVRGTATIAGGHVIHTTAVNGGLARFFSFNNPALTDNASRRADVFALVLTDLGRYHAVTKYQDPQRNWPDNQLWKYYGTVAGQATLTVTLPFIMPRRIGGTGVVPDPFQGVNAANARLEWALEETIFNSTSTGINQLFSYQDLSIRWFYESTSNSSAEKHTFIWQ
jgi:hypothetical protein